MRPLLERKRRCKRQRLPKQLAELCFGRAWIDGRPHRWRAARRGSRVGIRRLRGAHVRGACERRAVPKLRNIGKRRRKHRRPRWRRRNVIRRPRRRWQRRAPRSRIRGKLRRKHRGHIVFLRLGREHWRYGKPQRDRFGGRHVGGRPNRRRRPGGLRPRRRRPGRRKRRRVRRRWRHPLVRRKQRQHLGPAEPIERSLHPFARDRRPRIKHQRENLLRSPRDACDLPRHFANKRWRKGPHVLREAHHQKVEPQTKPARRLVVVAHRERGPKRRNALRLRQPHNWNLHRELVCHRIKKRKHRGVSGGRYPTLAIRRRKRARNCIRGCSAETRSIGQRKCETERSRVIPCGPRFFRVCEASVVVFFAGERAAVVCERKCCRIAPTRRASGPRASGQDPTARCAKCPIRPYGGVHAFAGDANRFCDPPSRFVRRLVTS